MNAHRPLALLMLLASAGLVAADVAPPPGKKWVPVTTVVEAAEEFPDYVFFTAGASTYYGSGLWWLGRAATGNSELEPGVDVGSVLSPRNPPIFLPLPSGRAVVHCVNHLTVRVTDVVS